MTVILYAPHREPKVYDNVESYVPGITAAKGLTFTYRDGSGKKLTATTSLDFLVVTEVTTIQGLKSLGKANSSQRREL